MGFTSNSNEWTDNKEIDTYKYNLMHNRIDINRYDDYIPWIVLDGEIQLWMNEYDSLVTFLTHMP